MAKKTRPVVVHCEPELIEELDALAKQNGISRAAVVKIAVSRMVAGKLSLNGSANGTQDEA